MQQIKEHQMTEINMRNGNKQPIKKQQETLEYFDQHLKVPTVISDEKQEYLLKQIIYTLLGYPESIEPFYLNIIYAFLMTAIIIIPPIIMGTFQFQALPFFLIAILIPTFLPPIIILVADVVKYGCLQSIFKNPQKLIILMAYGLLWSNHFYMLTRYKNVTLLVFSFISIITSVNTIAGEGIKQFNGNSPQFDKFGLDSTRYVRFLFVLPLLLAQFITDRIIGFNQIQLHFWPVRLISSVIFIFWFLGWISSLRNSFLLKINIINHVIGGDQKKNDLYYAIICLFLNLVPCGFYCILITDKLYGYFVLIGGATISSIIAFLSSMWIYSGYSENKSGWYKILTKIIIQLVWCASLLAIAGLVNFKGAGFIIMSLLNCSLFLTLLFFEDLFRGRSHFGCRFKLLRSTCGGSSKFLVFKRFILRVSISLTMIGITQEIYTFDYFRDKQIYQYIGWSNDGVNYFLMPLLIYRCFKRAISEPMNWSIHIAIFISFVCWLSGGIYQTIFIVALWPPFPNNFYMTLISPFIIPAKFRRPNQNLCVKIMYLIVTFASLILYSVTFGVLQLTMILGLPIFWCVIPSTSQGSQITTSQQSLYKKILKNLNCQLFEGRKQGIYLLRLEKYIMTVQIKSQCYGFSEIVQFRGMQAQEVTSCHSRQGQTIDLQVQETWIQDDQNEQNSCRIFSPYSTVLWPQSQHEVQIPIENDIKLTGILETSQFLSLFKNVVLHAFIYEFSKFQMNSQQKQHAEIMYSEINAIINKQPRESKTDFDFDFANKLKFSASIPNPSFASAKKKLPPIQSKKGKKQVINQFLDLIQQPKIQQENKTEHVQNQNKNISPVNPAISTKIDQINFSTVFTFYYYAVGKDNYVNLNKVYRIIAGDRDAIPQIQFLSKQEIASRAIGAAFKISVSKFIEGESTIGLEDFQQYDKNQFLGTIQSKGFSEAIGADKQDIWSMSFLKKEIHIKRLAMSKAKIYVFSVDEVIFKSVWNNLRFELLFVTNNDDERYSIQTHPKLLRNLWIESCQQPFGYAGYYSGDKINL